MTVQPYVEQLQEALRQHEEPRAVDSARIWELEAENASLKRELELAKKYPPASKPDSFWAEIRIKRAAAPRSLPNNAAKGWAR
jgi:hypothetical protein